MFGWLEGGGPGVLARLRQGLARTRDRLGLRLGELLRGRTKVDDELLAELEGALLEADIGPRTAERLLEALRRRVREERIADAERVRAVLAEEIRGLLAAARPVGPPGPPAKPHVVLLVGVNGTGKTTTLGKLAKLYAGRGASVVVGAADTFRAAAVEQLAVWCERARARLVRHREGADPAAVAFDAVETAAARGADVVLVDTAGRLHTRANLMTELEKVRRVLGRRVPGAPHETLLVLDATTGQNAVTQAREFGERAGITGLVVTKLDGTAKGGVVVAIAAELKLPVRYVGTGEGIDDLVDFDPDAFAEALL